MRNVLVKSTVCAFALSACIAPQVRPPEAPQAPAPPAADPLDPTTGYVGGLFSTSLGTGFSLVLVDERGNRRDLQFGGPRVALEGHLGLMALPPGKYRLSAWKALNFGNPKDVETDVPRDHPLARSFTLRPGGVVFLAKFNARKGEEYSLKADRMVTKWEIWQVALPFEEVKAVIGNARPDLAARDVRCLLCPPPAPSPAD